MIVEIDQSIKIEDTNKNTITGLSNGKTFTIVLKKQVKRKLQEEFRKRNQPRLFIYVTFSVVLVLLLKYAKLKNVSEIIIDNEYPGHEKFCKKLLLKMYGKCFEKIPNVRFGNIGKKSNAHNVCYLVMKKKIIPDKKIEFSEIKNICFK